MQQKTNDEELIIRYLLGELSPEERAQIQERFFTDDEFFKQMLAVENELIDSYARGELPKDERERCERLLGSPIWRQRVGFAKALANVVSETQVREEVAETHPPRVSWWQTLLAFLHSPNRAMRLSLAVMVLIMALGGPLLIWEIMRLRTKLDQLHAERQTLLSQIKQPQELKPAATEPQARGSEIAEQQEREQNQRNQPEKKTDKPPPAQRKTDKLRPAPQPIFSFLLSPRVVRDVDTTKQLIIPQKARLVNLQLDLRGADQYKSYHATLMTAGGDEVWKSSMLLAQLTRWGSAVILKLPAHVLTPGKYELTLKGVTADGNLDEVGYYYFSVVKK